MKVVDRNVGSIKPYQNNPRNNNEAVKAVKASIEAFGFRQPIVVDKDSIIIVGHTRFLAAKELGMTKVPVHVAEDMTPAQIAAYRLADNKVGEIATWDELKLMEELSTLEDIGFDMSELGFTPEELGQVEQQANEDLRYLENFEVMTKPKPRWILISAPEDECSEILTQIKTLGLKAAKVEYSGEPDMALASSKK